MLKIISKILSSVKSFFKKKSIKSSVKKDFWLNKDLWRQSFLSLHKKMEATSNIILWLSGAKILLNTFKLLRKSTSKPKIQQNGHNIKHIDQTVVITYINTLKTDLSRLRAQLLSLLMIAIILVGIMLNRRLNLVPLSSPYIAKIYIHGPITEEKFNNKAFLKDTIEKVAQDKKAVAVIVDINSFGGSPSTAELVHKYLRRLSSTKLTVALIEDSALSAGYFIASGCEKIIALESAMVGSIGVIIPLGYELSDLEKKLGIKSRIMATSEFKNALSTTRPISKNSEQYIKSILDDMHIVFIKHVAQQRKLTAEDIDLVANGKIFTGLRALQYKLVDGIGDEKFLVDAWKEKGIVPKDAKVVEINPPAQPKKSLGKTESDNFIGDASALIKSLLSLVEKIDNIASNGKTYSPINITA